MTNTYLPQAHTTVRVPGLEGIRGIVLVTPSRVWVEASFMDDLKGLDAIIVNDGTAHDYNVLGSCILSMPLANCTFYTDEEAQSIYEAEHADAQLLAYAIG